MVQNRRLIDANSLYDQAHDTFYSAFHRSMADLTDLKELIDDTSTVDAVEVVRCMDCRYWEERDINGKKILGKCLKLRTVMRCYCFCSYGERRNDDQK